LNGVPVASQSITTTEQKKKKIDLGSADEISQFALSGKKEIKRNYREKSDPFLALYKREGDVIERRRDGFVMRMTQTTTTTGTG
jgi:hypothetical protein